MFGEKAAQTVIATEFPNLVIDGIIPKDGKTDTAAKRILDRAITDRKVFLIWSPVRRAVAAAQVILRELGFYTNAIDGLAGNNTVEAYNDFLNPGRVVPREPLPVQPLPNSSLVTTMLPRQKDCAAFYGSPASGAVKLNIVSVPLPFPLLLDWDLNESIDTVSLHRRCGPSFVRAMSAVLGHYGSIEELDALGLRRYAGGYNHRKMRGGSSWSMHAYGCAVDFYAGPNGLTTRCPKALFCRPEYKPFLDIMQAHGWLPAIRLWGADAMHFQMARL